MVGTTIGAMIGTVMFAATLALKSKHLERTLLQDESAMVNQNLGLPRRIK